jgi:hypothetical protein
MCPNFHGHIDGRLSNLAQVLSEKPRKLDPVNMNPPSSTWMTAFARANANFVSNL